MGCGGSGRGSMQRRTETGWVGRTKLFRKQLDEATGYGQYPGSGSSLQLTRWMSGSTGLQGAPESSNTTRSRNTTKRHSCERQSELQRKGRHPLFVAGGTVRPELQPREPHRASCGNSYCQNQAKTQRALPLRAYRGPCAALGEDMGGPEGTGNRQNFKNLACRGGGEGGQREQLNTAL
jgi:hypothetical protein